MNYYTDKNATLIDQGRLAEDRAAASRIYALRQVTAKLIDSWLGNPGEERDKAECALSMMAVWAERSALLGQANFQGSSHRMWTLSALATDYLLIKEAKQLDPSQKRAVEAWLRSLARATQTTQGNQHNNHLHWAAAACAVAAIAADDPNLLRWSVAVGARVLDEVGSDGALPHEIRRGSLALRYHSFALSALTVIAEAAAANGTDLYSRNDKALRRIMLFTLSAISDEEVANAKFRVAQNYIVKSGRSIPWIEVLASRYPDDLAIEMRRKYRPILDDNQGGNVTLHYRFSRNKLP